MLKAQSMQQTHNRVINNIYICIGSDSDVVCILRTSKYSGGRAFRKLFNKVGVAHFENFLIQWGGCEYSGGVRKSPPTVFATPIIIGSNTDAMCELI